MLTTFSAWTLDFLSKAAGHKYIRRIPYASGGKTRYRYIYKVTHTAGGKHALHEDDVTVGAAFMLGTDKGAEVHAHVKSVDGDKVTVEYDDGPRKGEKETMSKRDLLSKLDAAHGISQALQGEREKQAKVVADLKARGASDKQVAREQARLERLSVSAPAPKSEESKKRAAKKPKSVEPAAEEPKSVEPAAEEPKSGDKGLDVLPDLSAPENKQVADAMRRVLNGDIPTSASIKRRIEAEKIAAEKPPYSLHDGRVVLNVDRYGWTIRLSGSKVPYSLTHSRKVGDPATLIAQVLQTPPTGDVKAYGDAVLATSAMISPPIRQLKAAYKDAVKIVASEAMLRSTDITQRGERPVQETTGKYAKDSPIPKSVQTALLRFVSKEESRSAPSIPFRRGEHMYSTDARRVIRIAVQSDLAESGPPADRIFESVQAKNKPTVTLDASTARSIAATCRKLDASLQAVTVTTRNGRTTFSADGVPFATVDAHTESAPTQVVNAEYLADMLSVEHPVTILQDPNAGPTSPLSAHTANTQQLLMPRRP